MTTWSVKISLTISGVIVDELRPIGEPKYAVTLCDKGSWGVDILLGSPPNTVDPVMAYATSGKYTWTVVGDGFPVQGGEPTSASYDQETRTLSVGGPGIGGRLDNRVVRAFTATPTALAAVTNNKTLTGLSRRGIMRQLVYDNTIATSNAYLPFNLESGAGETGTEARTYLAVDGATVWKKLAEESESQNGPEFVFRPFIATIDSVDYAAFALILGAPLIGDQSSNLLWELGAAYGSINLDYDLSVPRPHYAWAKGTGQGTATLVGFANNTAALTAAGVPYADYINTGRSDETNLANLNAIAAADIANYSTPQETWTVEVRTDGKNAQGVPIGPTLGGFAEGDQPQFRVVGHPVIPDDTYRRRIVGYSNGSNPGTVKLDLQPTPAVL